MIDFIRTHKLAIPAFIMAFSAGIAIPLRASGVGPVQAMLGIALLAALYVLAFDGRVRSRLKFAFQTFQGKLILVMLGAWAITIPFSYNPLASLEIGARTGGLVLGATIIWAVLREYQNAPHEVVGKGLVFASLSLSVMTLIAMSGVDFMFFTLKGVHISHVLNENWDEISFKAFAAITVCLMPAVVWTGRKLGGLWRWLGYAFIPLALTIIVWTENRSALVGFLAMVFVGGMTVVWVNGKHVKLMISAILASGAGIVAGVIYISTSSSFSLQASRVPTYLPYWLLDPHRQNIWRFVFERFLEHPWVGNGIDQSNRLPGSNQPVPGLSENSVFVPGHPHNWMLEIASETGLVGLLPVLAVLLYVAWKILKRFRQDGNEVDLALVMLMAGFWSSALLNFTIWAVWWQLTFLILFAILSATSVRGEGAR